MSESMRQSIGNQSYVRQSQRSRSRSRQTWEEIGGPVLKAEHCAVQIQRRSYMDAYAGEVEGFERFK